MNIKIIRNIAVTAVFCLFVFGFFFAAIFKEPVKYSVSERKELQQFPNITFDSVINKTAIQEFDLYSAHQFPLREEFLSLYRFYRTNLFKASSVTVVNGYGEKNGYLAQVETTLDENCINTAIDKFNEVYNTYLKDSGGKVYYSVIPMKDYYFNEKYNTPMRDYTKMLSMLEGGLGDFEYIDIFDLLSLEDYYKTDTHWSQDKILDVRDRFLEVIGGADSISGEYTVNEFSPFNGAYFKYAPVQVAPDTIYYLTNDVIEQMNVYDISVKNPNRAEKVYNTDKLIRNPDNPDSYEPYDVFLSGVRAALCVENPNAVTDKEIIVFRDSFGASIAPLLAEGYSKVYLFDLRQVQIAVLKDKFGEDLFKGKDVLFLYSTEILNTPKSFVESGLTPVK